MGYIYYIFIIMLAIFIFISLVYLFNDKKSREEESPIDVVPKIIVNIDELQKHAEEISREYSSIEKKSYNKTLIESLDRSFQEIVIAHNKIEEYQKNSSDRLYAAEWLLDNMFLIEKEYKYVKNNIPKKSYKNLPILNKGMMKDYPRIYHIAVELVSHTDGNIDEDVIEKFIKAYEKNTVLTSKELWMIPVMIRIALIQNISSIVKNIIFIQEEKKKADILAEEIINSLEKSNKEDFDSFDNKSQEFNCFFGERLFKILKDNGVENDKVYKWINEKLEIKEISYEKLILQEHKKEATMQISIGNSINSIRKIEAMNWRKYFEKLSCVESLLLKDPSLVYGKMDFDSKDYYRSEIERLSNKFKLPESFIVKKALECAKDADEKEAYKKHVGYYLVDDGIDILRLNLNISKNKKKNKILKNKSARVFLYINGIILSTVLLVFLFLTLSLKNDHDVRVWRYILAVLVLIVPCSEIVVSILNWSINYLSHPRFVPKIDLKKGIGEENRTVVIIPTIINNVKRAKELINHMEIYYLSNRFDNIYFTLLGDLKDAKKDKEDKDDEILEFTLNEIKKLNNKYAKDGEDIFFYLCRPRKFNPKEGKWIAWERKRGKIMEFNALLKGNSNTSFNVISGDLKNLKKVKYVITLDADTKLPRNSAKKLIGAMAHILNRPVIDKKKDRVVRGYGLLQPRIGVDVISANKTMFSRIFSGEVGMDIYTKAISDVYQDLFAEGIFTGKGIYDLDVFDYMLKDKVKENSVLSHDLLEGSYVKAGLVTDIELIDSYPAYYNSNSKRIHRWVRGDWQLLPWIFQGRGLNRLSRWKLIDNLRRSLLAPSVVLLIMLSFNILPDGTDKWIVAAILAVIAPILFDVTEFVTSPIKGISLSGRISGTKMVISQILLIVCFLPYKACLMVDAIIRTLYRLLVSKKHFLEWQTAEDAEAKSGKDLMSYVKNMWQGSVLAVIILFLAFNYSIGAFIFILPFCTLWFLSPVIAYYISKESKEYCVDFSFEEIKEIRSIARRTWAYFEDFVNEGNNWLAPDNYQEYAHKGLAPRTSPTNLGMGLITNIVAHDLGYIGILEFVERIENIVLNMENLEKLRGHFYNWYNTKTKEPLHPRYISTVDSGNLVGYLWVIEEAIKEYIKDFKNKDYAHIYFEGLKDTCILADEEILEEIGIENYYSSIIKEVKEGSLNLEELENLLQKFIDKYRNLKLEKEPYWNNKLYISLNKLYKEVSMIIKDRKSFEEDMLQRVKILLKKISDMAENTDFTLVFDKERELFSIGYNVENNSLGESFYDLMASEARQATFVAIVKGDISEVVWYKLGRALTKAYGRKALVSWSGTMFEYFMPFLIMKDYDNTLLHETYVSVIKGQKAYCSSKKIPWGISESAFNHFDVDLNYQYKAFGVPGIGVKRGLGDELVVSPYSTFLAMQVDKKGALKNVYRLKEEGALGRYGFYEAIDYTKARLKEKEKAVVQCFMVHHQGMSFMALDNVLNNNILQKRFHRIPRVKAGELLLQERIPKTIVYEREKDYSKEEKQDVEKQNIIVRRYSTSKTLRPRVQLLSNGEYSLMLSNSGSGYSKYNSIYMYRWREDVTLDDKGFYFYIKDITDNEYFSSTYEPCKTEGSKYEVEFSLDKVRFRREDKELLTDTEIIVSYEDNAEIRKISITNSGDKDKIVEVTSFAEVIISDYSSDLVHPAFQNLFVQTEYDEGSNCVIATRRQRKKSDKKPWVMQVSLVKGESIGSVQYETSRANFIGRGRNLRNPLAMDNNMPLKNTTGTVLDPIIALRRKIKIPRGSRCQIVYTMAFANSKEEVIDLAKKYSEYSNIERNFVLSWTQAQLEMKYLGVKSSQANLYQEAASKILFLNGDLRERQKYIKRINKSQNSLWKYGISGDLPIILLICKNEKHIDSVRQLLKAQEYLKIKGLNFDLVIINLEETSYTEPVQNSIGELILASSLRDKQNVSGGVFLYNRSSICEEDVDFLKAISRIVVDGDKGSFINQIKDVEEYHEEEELLAIDTVYNYETLKIPVEELEYFNGYGGFNKEGNKYIIVLRDNKNTPAPWINVISNKNFGFHVSERGSAYSWCLNSRENKITTWSNDWIKDYSDEILYLRDEINGKVWSITANPIRDSNEYVIEHGFGYSSFSHESNGILGKLTMFVPIDEKLKLCIVDLKNLCKEDREISATYYSRLVLGVVPEKSAQYISTYFNEENSYIYGSNPYNGNFSKLKAYLKVIGGEEFSFTGDRKEFLGRGGKYSFPEALKKKKLSSSVGAGLDPCLVYNTKIKLKAKEEKKLVVILGEEESLEKINSLIKYYSDYSKVTFEFERVKSYWENLLHTLKVQTPDKTMNIMLNGWLIYQTLACRIWARTAFYQSGGAYGFRDQLQDVMSFSYLKPEMIREQILYSAERQYLEGDVQHWWHPFVESGIRTRFSDDLLWLPYVTIYYINSTGDYEILNEEVSYLEDKPLLEGEDERYSISNVSSKKGSIYEHCVKAIERSLKLGVHGIPLMGSGDWNDGMNTVGNKGKGESVWLGWFLFNILNNFSDLCVFKKDEEMKNRCVKYKEIIRENLEKNAWDGNWYKRAYFDDETPLGSKENDECQIDSLAQSWAVISKAGDLNRTKEAMNSLDNYLVKEDKGMVLLLTPPFDKSNLEPGYIKGYVKGVRENGGQYTHAATWVIWAFTKLGLGNKAFKIYNMINPINHSKSYLESENYKTEPYVMTADVYDKEPYEGRGGWSWYTGTSGWMYRVAVEGILGLKLEKNIGFRIEPCIPKDWNEYSLEFRKSKAIYKIKVLRANKNEIIMDGEVLKDKIIPYKDRGEHSVEVKIM
ncbi:GH36-type glycosyl hydrolase domain-containing protein [Haloimpatiens sp. FM7315]|uniref:GH36-type glycosyl hydrolase domain-containing protein n=1 Tax=Haloimpatiens sp. FM7315 TaxID=3298609 RepID=UPI003977379C